VPLPNIDSIGSKSVPELVIIPVPIVKAVFAKAFVKLSLVCSFAYSLAPLYIKLLAKIPNSINIIKS